MNYQRLILVGNATDDAQRQTSKKADVTYATLIPGVSSEGLLTRWTNDPGGVCRLRRQLRSLGGYMASPDLP
jgi:hypothetical protein